MEDIFIEGKREFPTIDFKTNGFLSLSGKSYPENSAAVYEPLIEFVSKLTVSKIEFIIDLEYLNTSSTKFIENIIHLLDDNETFTDVTIVWKYDIEDEEGLELGEILSERVEKCRFIFQSISEE